MCAQLGHGLEAFGDLAVFHEPTGRLRTEEDADAEDEGGDEGRAELETPGDPAGIFDDYIGRETEENPF